MTGVYETEAFEVEARDKPHVTRADGGHLVIRPKKKVSTRQELTTDEANELMKLTRVVGDAMTVALNKRGVDIGRINYQDNGNWSVFAPDGPHLHIHLYGRAKSATIQKYGDALNFPHMETGFYNQNEPLSEDDVAAIREEMAALLDTGKY